MGAERQEKNHPKAAFGSRDRVFRLLLGLLALLFLLCLLTLIRGYGLRRDLNLHLRQSDALHQLRAELELLQSTGGREEPAAPTKQWQETWRQAEAHAQWEGDTQSLIALRNLGLALGSLRQAAAPDTRWDSLLAVLAAANDVEGYIQERQSLLHQSLGGIWAAVAGLAVAALLLAAAALALVHRLRQRHEILEAAHGEALSRATRDQLTGLWNRDAMLGILSTELERSRRLQVPLGVILVDLDRFQEISRWVGSARGDEILEQVAARLASLLRPYDTLGRISNGGFLTVLPACDEIATAGVAARLLQAVQDREIDHALGKVTVKVTLAKITIHQPTGTVADALAARLGAAITRAREDGKGPDITLDDGPSSLV